MGEHKPAAWAVVDEAYEVVFIFPASVVSEEEARRSVHRVPGARVAPFYSADTVAALEAERDALAAEVERYRAALATAGAETAEDYAAIHVDLGRDACAAELGHLLMAEWRGETWDEVLEVLRRHLEGR